MSIQSGSVQSRRVMHGVTGGIAAYKAAEITSALVQLGAEVDVILTNAAREFIQPLTFSALTRREVHFDSFAAWSPERAGHVTLATEADVLLVAPATAGSIAKLSLGLADDLLGMVALATPAPLVVAPAMEHGMWQHPATQEHVDRLRERGAHIVAPERGRLASGASGDGRLAAAASIVGAVRFVLGRAGPLAQRKIVVSAGGTHEPIDPVRFIGNRSSGLMGFALAQAALDLGAAVTLVAGPTHLAPPYGAATVHVETAAEMLEAIQRAVADADVLVMAAAVADFRPVSRFEQKYKKTGPDDKLVIGLVQNPDILASVKHPQLFTVGFAAETENMLINARGKLERKALDMIVANDATATIGQPDSRATILTRDGAVEALPAMPKPELAALIMRRVATLVQDAGAGS